MNEIDSSELLDRLARVMRARGLNRTSWSKAAGMTENALKNLFDRNADGGTSSPKIANLARLCRAAGIPTWTILHPNGRILDLFLRPQNEQEGFAGTGMGEVADALLMTFAQMLEEQQRTNAALVDELRGLRRQVAQHLSLTEHAAGRIDDIGHALEVTATARASSSSPPPPARQR